MAKRKQSFEINGLTSEMNGSIDEKDGSTKINKSTDILDHSNGTSD